MAPNHVSVKVEVTKEGTRPPIYILGSFSEPAWHPHEMEYTVHDNVYNYYKELLLEAGKEYQYKFRVGSGDWWMLNEGALIVTDDVGNRNNLLKVPSNDISSSGDPSALETDQEEPATAKSFNQLDPTSKTMDTAVVSIPQQQALKPTPIVAVQETYSKPSFGEKSGNIAKEFQQDEQHLRALGTEPSFVSNRSGLDTPDVAAEVADATRFLDREVATSLISDEEAGRIGLRRLSHTPISEVANTAAEVAESAARIDTGRTSTIDMPPTLPGLEAVSGSNTTTIPMEGSAPRYTHISGAPPVEVDRTPAIPRATIALKREPIEDSDDSSIEECPQDGQSTTKQASATKDRLQQYNNVIDGSPASPAVGMGRTPSVSDLPSLDSRASERDPSPSLKLVSEEHARASMPSLPMTLNSGSDNKPSVGSEFSAVDHKGGESKEEASSSDTQSNNPVAASSSSLADTENLRSTTVTRGTQDNPSVRILAATSASSVVDADSASTTATDGDNRAQLKHRARTSSPLAARPVTPNSINSNHSVKSKNFLTAFFRTLFVDWLGGLIMRLCGGRRGST